MKTTLRPVTDLDASAICAIYNPYVRETVISFEQAPVAKADMAQRIREYSALYPWLVAEWDGRVVAYAYATLASLGKAMQPTTACTPRALSSASNARYNGLAMPRPVYALST